MLIEVPHRPAILRPHTPARRGRPSFPQPAVRVPLLLAVLLVAGCNDLNLRQWVAPEADTVTLTTQADAAYRLEDWDAAEQAYQRLIRTFPKNAEFQFRLANINVYQGRLEEAIGCYRAALAADPGHTGAWHNLGFTQLRLATRTFLDMQEHADTAAPESARARAAVQAISSLLSRETGVELPVE